MTNRPASSQEKTGDAPSANRLIWELSPYLLQHAHNPVDWYPWSEEAFQKAKAEDKPVFLSVGYSTCHWCHVMAHESFEDQEVAGLLNDAFVCIKVDREERPDIDQMYMAVALGMTGRGGWPLTIIMTWDKKPFFAATYIPRSGRFGQAGLTELIPRVKGLWKDNRDELLGSAAKIIDYLQHAQNRTPGTPQPEMSASVLDQGYESLSAIYDAGFGGFGTAPKFPTAHNLLFLLRYGRQSKRKEPWEMVENTLQAMRQGGIYDQVGYGFHRYSTDREWFVPHFEKMLYDQAMLVMAYVEAYQATGKEDYARTAREVLEYVRRDMTSPEGGFFSAEDADSQGVEGKFYLWTAEELRSCLENEEMRLMIRLFDIHESGNFEGGRNILRLRSSLRDAAAVLKVDEEELQDRLERMRRKLFAAREMRIRPSSDDKILTDWNGLMIAAFAKAAQALQGHEPMLGLEYASTAKRAANFLLENMRTADGRLLHRYRSGIGSRAGIEAKLDDHAFLIWGLIELYEAVFDIKYLKAALELNQVMLQHFWDEKQGGLFFTPDDGEALLIRPKESYDGAVPSGNSVAMLNLLRLSRLMGDSALEEKANAIALASDGAARSRGPGNAMLLSALDYALGPSYEVALVGSPEDEEMQRMLQAIRSRFLPGIVVMMVPANGGDLLGKDGDKEESSRKEMETISKFTKNMVQLQGRATAYVCSGKSCCSPITDPKKVMDLLEKTT